MSICDLLFSADMIVPSPRETVAGLTRSIGLPAPGERAFVDYPESGWDCVFALVNKAWRVGPTRLEVLGPKSYPSTPAINHGRLVTSGQGERPCKTHGTVIATSEFERLVDHVRRTGLRHWLEAPGRDGVSFPRLWLGVSDEQPYSYQPADDGGLVCEFIPLESEAFPASLLGRPAPEPVDPTAGQMTRILSRTFLVDDIDGTLRTLERNLLWEPDAEVVRDDSAGYSFVALSRNYEGGATIRLLQPLDQTRSAGEFHRTWGNGPYTIRIAVHDLAAKQDDLRSRSTSFVVLPETAHEPERVSVDSSATASMPFEFVEHGTTKS